VKVLITIPIHHYYQLLASCEPSSHEYKALTARFSGAEQHPGAREVHIFCEIGSPELCSPGRSRSTHPQPVKYASRRIF
jgi:hypothetical protein